MVTNRGSTREYFKDMVYYCDPSDYKSIRAAVVAAYNATPNNLLRDYIKENFTWDKAAEITLDAYHWLLGGNEGFHSFGTRPEAIKLAPVILELQKHSAAFDVIICVTAQHREMLDQVLKIFEIIPDYDLDVMQKNQDLFDVTANSLLGLRGVLNEIHPDIVVVQGDTTTAFVAGLAAYYLKIPIAHVEAGLRTNDKYSPFPEEKKPSST